MCKKKSNHVETALFPRQYYYKLKGDTIMLEKIISQIRLAGSRLIISIKDFPATLLLATATVVTLIYTNHLKYGDGVLQENLTRLAMVLALGIPLSLSTKVFIERKEGLGRLIRLALYGGNIVLLALYYLFFLNNLDQVSISRYTAFTISLYLIFSFIPYLPKGRNYELYVVTLFNRFVTTYLYSAILFLGLLAIISTINILFTANIPGTIYLDLWFIVVGIFAPAFFLADIPIYGQNLRVKDYSKVLKVLLLYIVMPLITVYSFILYAYFIKILITAQWPEGILANLVLWYSILSTIVIFFIYPLRDENKWVKIFISLFPKLIIPLLLMMFVSLGIRIGAYGVTENRYYVLIAGLWVMASMIYFAINKNASNIIITISLAIISVMTVIGPWSSHSISRFSQNKRFENLLRANNMLSNENIIQASPDISKGDREEISSILLYFQNQHSLKDLKYIPTDFDIGKTKNIFGFELEEEYFGPSKSKYFSHNTTLKGEPLYINDYNYFADYTYYGNTSLENNTSSITVNYSEESRVIEIKDKGKIIYRKNIDDIVKIVHQNNINKHEISLEEASYVHRTPSVEILYVFNNISGVEGLDGKITIHPPMFYIFVKIK